MSILRILTAAALTTAVMAVFGSSPLAAASPTNCTPQEGQALIDAGRYGQAIREFTCVIGVDPTAVEGYRGRIEARLMLGRYSDALGDYARVTAFVEPVHPDAHEIIRAGYADRLAIAPQDLVALTGASFERWADYDYAQALWLLDKLLAAHPDDSYGILFRGSSRMLQGGPGPKHKGMADLERAIALAPASPDVRWVVADAYTYGSPDLERAFAEATLALDRGLDTPRVHAILATVYNANGDLLAAADHIKTTIDLSTTQLVAASPLLAGSSLALDLVPGRTYEIPIPVTAGQTISISTGSRDFWDSIAVLLAPDGSPVVGSDDANHYFAAFDWVAPATGTYRLQATSFEAINTGTLVVTRD